MTCLVRTSYHSIFGYDSPNILTNVRTAYTYIGFALLSCLSSSLLRNLLLRVALPPVCKLELSMPSFFIHLASAGPLVSIYIAIISLEGPLSFGCSVMRALTRLQSTSRRTSSRVVSEQALSYLPTTFESSLCVCFSMLPFREGSHS